MVKFTCVIDQRGGADLSPSDKTWVSEKGYPRDTYLKIGTPVMQAIPSDSAKKTT